MPGNDRFWLDDGECRCASHARGETDRSTLAKWERLSGRIPADDF
jgi:hypothetical protein